MGFFLPSFFFFFFFFVFGLLAGNYRCGGIFFQFAWFLGLFFGSLF